MRTTTRTDKRTHRTRILLVAVASAAALLAAGAGRASAAPSASFTPTNTCWKDVVNDWLAHQPNVQNLYPIPCYTQAIQHLSAYADVQAYSSAMDDIHRALLAALLEERGNGPGGGASSGGGGSTPPSSSSGAGTPPPSSSSSSSSSEGPITKLFNSVGPGNATSVPLPLLVLGALAGLLLLAAAGTWGARRIQARKPTPAPQPATSPPSGSPRKPR